MADGTNDKPQRTAADKERSRQMSRSISGKGATRAAGRAGTQGNGRATKTERGGQPITSAKARRDAQR